MHKDITIIVILYKTPIHKIANLNQFKNFNLSILEQGSQQNSKKKIQKILNFKFNYYYSKENLGLSKGINFLIKKTKTKYCLITEPDIFIKEKAIINLKKTIKKNKKFLLVGPKYTKKKLKGSYKLTTQIDLSCVLFEKKKLIKFKFYDEDFFFFWTDVELVKRVNNSIFKMIVANNSYAKHQMSSSSRNNIYINFLRDKSYKYGEFIFDFKCGNIRVIKILRQLVQNFIRIFFCIVTLDKKNFFKYLGYFFGTLEFIPFLFKKILS